MKILIVMMMATGSLLAGPDDSFLIRGAAIHPVSGPNVENASLLVIDGKIVDIGGLKMAGPKGIRIVDQPSCLSGDD